MEGFLIRVSIEKVSYRHWPEHCLAGGVHRTGVYFKYLQYGKVKKSPRGPQTFSLTQHPAAPCSPLGTRTHLPAHTGLCPLETKHPGTDTYSRQRPDVSIRSAILATNKEETLQ